MNPRANLALLCLAIGLVLAASTAHGRTWRVEKDGSGDYGTIQPAVDVASAGDTILIGPGRYTETTIFDPDWSKDVYPKPVLMAVTVDDLTILGAGADLVTLSPEIPDTSPNGPEGIVTDLWIEDLCVRGITIENVYNGMYAYGYVDVADCVFQKSNTGIVYWDENGMVVRSCVISYCNIGLSPLTATNVLVEASSFCSNSRAIVNVESSNVAIVDCQFADNYIAIDYQQGSSGSVHDCSASGEYSAVYIRSHSSVQLEVIS